MRQKKKRKTQVKQRATLKSYRSVSLCAYKWLFLLLSPQFNLIPFSCSVFFLLFSRLLLVSTLYSLAVCKCLFELGESNYVINILKANERSLRSCFIIYERFGCLKTCVHSIFIRGTVSASHFFISYFI